MENLEKDIIHDYTLTLSALEKWIKYCDKTGTFKHQDNLMKMKKN
jgi:transposase